LLINYVVHVMIIYPIKINVAAIVVEIQSREQA